MHVRGLYLLHTKTHKVCFETAAIRGHLPTPEFLCDMGWNPTPALELLAKNGHLVVLERMLQRAGTDFVDEELWVTAAMHGLVEVLQMLLAVRYPYRTAIRNITSYIAACECKPLSLEFLANIIGLLDVNHAYIGAARSTTVQMLEWLYARFGVIESEAITSAAVVELKFDNLQWLRAKGFPFGVNTMILAYNSRNNALMEFVRAIVDP
jgi:hypothetical protein